MSKWIAASLLILLQAVDGLSTRAALAIPGAVDRTVAGKAAGARPVLTLALYHDATAAAVGIVRGVWPDSRK